MDLQTATRLSGTEGRIARFVALVCFGIACGLLATSLVEQGGTGAKASMVTGSVAR